MPDGMSRDVAVVMEPTLVAIDPELLALVSGGADPTPGDLGRCGPASGWKWLGNVRTRECKAHDTAVRNSMANGSSTLMSHVKALPLLPAAVASYFRERF
jgi:hypothetical protein